MIDTGTQLMTTGESRSSCCKLRTRSVVEETLKDEGKRTWITTFAVVLFCNSVTLEPDISGYSRVSLMNRSCNEEMTNKSS